MEPGAPLRRTRRIFLADLGRAAVGLVVLGAACSDDAPAGSTTSGSPATTQPPATTSADPTTSGAAPTSSTSAAPTSSQPDPEPGASEWARIDLGFVSAYAIVRRGEAVLVDAGNRGDEGSIEGTLTALGVGWDALGHVIITHRHPDHIGSVDAVMTLAGAATAYAGAEDIPSINAPRAVTAVSDGDTVAGLEIIATPGHTAGHVSVLDSDLGVLLAGDSMIGEDGGVSGPSPRFTDDLELANTSVAKMAGFEFDTVLFGHGEPVIGGASDLVQELADSL